MDWNTFSAILTRRARQEARLGGMALPGTVLFGDGLNFSSVAFLESIMELEEETGQEFDVESLDASIKTAGQLFQRLFPGQPLPPG